MKLTDLTTSTQTASTAPFFDIFFICCAAFVFLLFAIDFYLGKKGRQDVKNKVADWWVYLESSSYAGLGADDARKVLSFFYYIFGSFGSLRFWILASLAAFLSIFLMVLIEYVLVLDAGWSSIQDATDRFWIDLNRSPAAFFWNTAIVMLSFVVTLEFLKMMASGDSFKRLAALILCDFFVALSLPFLYIAIEALGSVFSDGRLMLMGMLPAMIPSLVHLVFTSSVMVSKLVTPIFKKPISVTLERLNESNRGTLTLVGIGIGTSAKLLQQLIKVI